MVTIPEPTPDERAKLARVYRRNYKTYVIFAVAFAVLGFANLFKHRASPYISDYAFLLLSLGWVAISWKAYRMMRTYESPG